jgi:hypothetical protein
MSEPYGPGAGKPEAPPEDDCCRTAGGWEGLEGCDAADGCPAPAPPSATAGASSLLRGGAASTGTSMGGYVAPRTLLMCPGTLQEVSLMAH